MVLLELDVVLLELDVVLLLESYAMVLLFELEVLGLDDAELDVFRLDDAELDVLLLELDGAVF